MDVNQPIKLRTSIFDTSETNFEDMALKMFHFQYLNNDTYRAYCDLMHVKPENISSINKIPFLPIQFFKNRIVQTTHFKEEIIFESSGTTGAINSKHFVKEKKLYEESYLSGFRHFYGDEKKMCIIGLLPSYLERQHSSLVYMVDDLIQKSGHANSGFYLYDYQKLIEVLMENETAKQPTLLIGVTYALLDFAEQYPMHLQHTIVMETGGMKGRREELTRSEVHKILTEKLGLEKIHSEYGMTELLSQAYSKGDGVFDCSNTMKVLVRSEDDPLEITSTVSENKKLITGGINIIDLANLYSCAFIATDDVGKLYANGSFEVIGRLENSDIRGCGLMLV